MLKSKTRWVVRQTDRQKAEKLVQELNIAPLVASLLVNRGIDTVESARCFLFLKDQSFHDPYLLKDMDKAVERIRLAIERQEPILIYGDYDADGVTSTSVMMMTLRDLGANVEFYIPNRFNEGYGPNEAAFRLAREKGFKLIITVDTGISALHEANVASEIGIDLIITDHHEPGPILPEALAIIHPKRKDSTYPFRELAGVGVAFKLSQALYGHVPEHLLEIAAIGTIADLVPLQGENRLIAQKGIQKLKETKNIGLQSLLKISSIEPESIDEETIGFVIAPRLNAAGRMETADSAVHLLLTDDKQKAEILAEKIDLLNKERQELVNAITEEAVEEVESLYPLKENLVLVIGKEGWNSGVIGIVASRLVEKFYRPVIVLTFDTEKGLAKGSARSIAGFDLFKNLSACRDILPHFGGHTMAAGMTLHLEDVDELRFRLNALAKDQLTEEDSIPVTNVDGKIDLSDIHLSAIEQMQMLAPYGVDNPKPKVLIEDVNISSIRKIGSDQSHLKITLESDGASLDGVGFGMGHYYEHISPYAKLSVIGELAINEWNNIRKPQVYLQDLAVQSWQLFDFRGLKSFDKLAEFVPQENRKWIVFNEENVPKCKGKINGEIDLITSCEEALKMEIDGMNIVLADFPPSRQILENLLAGKKPARIYVQFYKEDSNFFTTIPTRDHFKWFYAFLAKKGPFDLKRYGDDLAKYRGWTKETIELMSQVFLELNFVTINNGYISLEKNIHKRDLTDSKTYQQKLAQYTLENDLLYSSFQQLKGWFDQVIQESVKNEEAMSKWI